LPDPVKEERMIWRSNWCRACLLAALTASCVHASDTSPAHLYALTTETGMPHLEENLRYAVTREEQCLGREDLSSAFPILRHPSFAGCALREEDHRDDTISYVLVCEGANGMMGSATWRVGERVIRGTLDVKLGGKNMTVFQRVIGTLVRECS
jgi:hypothetical protein